MSDHNQATEQFQPIQATQDNIEVDQVAEDSDYASGAQSETQSLTPSLHEFIERNGRRYHTYYGPDKNPMPNDETEKERLDIMHELLLLSTGHRLYQAPLHEIELHNCLDLGTGTGIWAIDFAQAHPEAVITGIDLSPIQPRWVPGNCRFQSDDFELDWTFTTPFDYIHARAITQSVADWPRLLTQARRALRPGGIFELAEAVLEPKSDDNSLPADWPPVIIFGLIRQALRQISRGSPNGEEFRRMLEDAGFVDVQIRAFKVPMGTWPKNTDLKQAGGLMMLSIDNGGYEAYAQHLLTTILGMGDEETLELCKRAEMAHYERGVRAHPYVDYYSVYGWVPEN